MSAGSIYIIQNTLNHWLCNTAIPVPPTPWLALFHADTGLLANDGALQDEVDNLGYNRVDVSGKFDAADSEGECILNDTIEFPEASEDWGEVTHFAILDAETDGNILVWDELQRPRTILEGDVYRVRVGNLKVKLT